MYVVSMCAATCPGKNEGCACEQWSAAQHEERQVGFNGKAHNESSKEGGRQLEEDAKLVTNSILHFDQVTMTGGREGGRVGSTWSTRTLPERTRPRALVGQSGALTPQAES